METTRSSGAVGVAEQAGQSNGDTAFVRKAIEGRARELVDAAKEDLDAKNTKEALIKLRLAKQLAKPDGPTARAAQKLLSANGA